MEELWPIFGLVSTHLWAVESTKLPDMGKQLEPEAIIARNVQQLMNKAGLSNARLGEKAGVGHGTIDRIRRGEANVTVKNLAAVAKALDVEAWQLLIDGWEPSNPPALQPITEAERRLYAQWEALRRSIAGQPSD